MFNPLLRFWQIRQRAQEYSSGTIWNRLFAPVDIAALAYFRIAFGAIMLWDVWSYFADDLIKRYYIDPTIYFHYYGFDWLQPWPGDLMYPHFYILGAAAICIMLGFAYRISSALFFLGFTYVFLLDQTYYLNHNYLISLISMLMIFVPAHRAFSIDALLRPEIRTDTAPAWSLWMLQAQIGIVYFYGGLAKFNGDFLRGDTMRIFLYDDTDLPLIGSLFTEQWLILSFTYAALLIDLLAAPMLLWRRTRLFTFGIVVVFHLLNSQLFNIGIFPWFMIAATLLFFPPEWPRRIFNFIWKSAGRQMKYDSPITTQDSVMTKRRSHRKVIITLLMIYFIVQLTVPLRHHLYPGEVLWTEEGHDFSWQMMLYSKYATEIAFYLTDPKTNEVWTVDLDDLTSLQRERMAKHTDMILQYSHYLADDFRQQGYEDVEVRAWVMVSLNGREPQLMIDPEVDLAAQPRTLLPASWIIPLED
jgi:hypothetical protein